MSFEGFMSLMYLYSGINHCDYEKSKGNSHPAPGSILIVWSGYYRYMDRIVDNSSRRTQGKFQYYIDEQWLYIDTG